MTNKNSTPERCLDCVGVWLRRCGQGFTLTPRGFCSVFFAVFVVSGSVMCMAGIAGIFLLAGAVFPSLSSDP